MARNAEDVLTLLAALAKSLQPAPRREAASTSLASRLLATTRSAPPPEEDTVEAAAAEVAPAPRQGTATSSGQA